MPYRILGPVEIRRPDGPAALGGPKGAGRRVGSRDVLAAARIGLGTLARKT